MYVSLLYFVENKYHGTIIISSLRASPLLIFNSNIEIFLFFESLEKVKCRVLKFKGFFVNDPNFKGINYIFSFEKLYVCKPIVLCRQQASWNYK